MILFVSKAPSEPIMTKDCFYTKKYWDPSHMIGRNLFISDSRNRIGRNLFFIDWSKPLKGIHTTVSNGTTPKGMNTPTRFINIG